MYFHPLILTEAQKQQRLAAYQDFSSLWLEGINRQHRLHADAFSAFCARQQENLRSLSESFDITDLIVRWSARAAPAPLDLLQVSMRSGEITADVQRQVAVLADRHAKELSRSVFERGVGAGTSPRGELRDHGKARRRQMMA